MVDEISEINQLLVGLSEEALVPAQANPNPVIHPDVTAQETVTETTTPPSGGDTESPESEQVAKVKKPKNQKKQKQKETDQTEVAVTMTDLELKETLTDLSAFGFDELRPAAIQDIISEIPAYRAIIASTSVTFWSEVDGADKYDHGLSKKQEGDPEQYTDRTWKDDRIEQSRRVWEWWRVKGSNLHYFFSAARLVAIVPLSSASVERVFSQVKFIIETVGENVLEETLEARVMERVNDYTL